MTLLDDISPWMIWPYFAWCLLIGYIFWLQK